MKGILKTSTRGRIETRGPYNDGYFVRNEEFWNLTDRCHEVDTGLIRARVSPETRFNVLKREREVWKRQRRDDQLKP